MGKEKRNQRSFLSVAKKNSGFGESKFEDALSLHRQGNYDDAILLYQGVLLDNPSHIPTIINLGVIYYIRGSFDLAKDSFLKVLAFEPNEQDALYNLGKTMQMKKEWAKSLEYLKKADEIQPSDPLIQKALADSYFQLGLYLEAAKLLSIYLEGFQDDSRALIIFAKSLIALGRFEDAELALRRVVELEPAWDVAFELLADCHYHQNRLERAMNCLRKVLDLRKNDPAVYRKLAMYHGQLKEYSEARKYYWNAYNIESKDLKIREVKNARLNMDIDRIAFQNLILSTTEKYAQTKNWKGALSEFIHLSKQHPGSLILLQEIAYIYQSLGELRRASSYYEKILSQDYENLESMLQLIRIAIELDDEKYAQIWMDKALEAFYGVCEVHELCGLCCANFGRYEKALEHFAFCKQNSHDTCSVMMGLSECYMGLLDYSRAVDLLKSAVEIFPNSAQLFLNLSWSYLRLEMVQEAMEIMNDARKHHPHDFQILARSAQVSIAAKNYKKAGMLWKELAGMLPDSRQDYPTFIRALIHVRDAQSALKYLKDYSRFRLKNFEGLYLESLIYLVQKNRISFSISWQELWFEYSNQILESLDEMRILLEPKDIEFLLLLHPQISRFFAAHSEIIKRMQVFLEKLQKPATFEVVK